ncbi:MAG TPA: hypothetical protein V6D16_17360, partial [Candidatus Obscuribacterales bacterium]
MFPSKFLVLATLGILPIAIACTEQSSPTAPASSASPAISPSPSASSAPSASPTNAIAPGQYCYRADLPTLTKALRLTVAADQTVTGDSRATIQNKSEGYYSSYAQKISGSLAGNQLKAQIRTWIEYDVQDTQEAWSITPSEVVTRQAKLVAADCEEVRSRFANKDGLEARDLLDSASAVNTKPVQF